MERFRVMAAALYAAVLLCGFSVPAYVVKEYITPEQLAVRVRSIERQEAARAHKEAKRQPPIAEQLKAAQKAAQEHRAPDTPKKKAPDRGDR